MTPALERAVSAGTLALVAVGGALGAIARVEFSAFIVELGVQPWRGTALINVMGGIAIGWLFVHIEARFRVREASRLLPTPNGTRIEARGYRLAPDPTLPPVDIFRSDTRLRLWSGFLITGVLGGFTTFSSYALEISNLLATGDRWALWRALFGATLLPIAGTFLGLTLGERTLRPVQPSERS